MAQTTREFDVVLYGAASFVGKLAARYMHQTYGVGGDLKWAIAGRNQSKLDEVKSALGEINLPTIIADAADGEALAKLAASTKVVCTTVGPYALFGNEVVAACAHAGTHYCDLTGEPQWMSRMINAHEDTAKKTGARIVHNCGFDSIPSDLGVWFTQQQAMEKFGEPCSQIRMGVKKIKGGASGGTVDSMINAVEEAKADPAVRKMMQNPYGVCPKGQQSGVRQLNVTAPTYLKAAKSWLAPFIMAAINTRVVHRSHALAGHPWGKDFMYDEAMMMGDGFKGRLRATSFAAAMGAGMAAVAVSPTRKVMQKFALPKAGEGPSPAEQEAGKYDLRFYGTTASGKTIECKVTGDKDPGYGSTSKMLSEAAVCLAKDFDDAEGGFPTPSVAMGDKLLGRLVASAGLTFNVV
jgi:short subunit dehydrogenase-like uncharacterized protein